MAETTLDEDQRAIARRHRIAEMLMSQGSEPLATNQMAGGYVVPVSPLAGVAKVAQQLSGAYISKKADEKAGELRDRRLSALGNIDFNSPDAANQLAKNGMIEEAIKMRMNNAADKSGTPGQWFIPAGAKPYKDESGMTGYQLPDGSIIPNRFSQTEYQQRMTDPANRGAVQAAVSGNTVSKATNEAGQEFHDFNKNLNPAIASGMPGAQAPQIDISPEASAADRAMLMEIAKKTGGTVNQQPVMSQTPAEQAAAKISAETQEKASIDLPKVINDTEYSLKLLSDIKNHPGLSDIVGVPNILTNPFGYTLPGTGAADFKAREKQIAGKQFLQAFEVLKGGGQITEIEGEKVTEAMARLAHSQSEKEYKNSLDELSVMLNKGLDLAKTKAGHGDVNQNASQDSRHDDSGTNDTDYQEYLRSHKK